MPADDPPHLPSLHAPLRHTAHTWRTGRLVDRPGELRPANPATRQVDPLSVQAWIKQQLNQPAPLPPGPLLPPAVGQYLTEQYRLRPGPLTTPPGRSNHQR